MAVWSALPSQSLSLPSQISGVGSTHPSHFRPWAPLHASRPARHRPTLTCDGSRPSHTQLSPTPGNTPSSMWPLQASSTPFHTSGVTGAFPRSQVTPILSAEHSVRPRRRHAPVRPLSHALPTLNPSSTSPLQLLSMPSHTSAGMGQPPGCPQAFSGKPSSICPLQLSSRQFAVSTAQCLAAAPSLLSASLGSVLL